MRIITNITTEPRQRFVLNLDNNETAILKLYYYTSQNSWYFDIEYGEYRNCGNKVVLTMNAIRHLRNKLPFGIAFLSNSEADPFQLEDFASGNAILLLLNQDEVNEIEDLVYNE